MKAAPGPEAPGTRHPARILFVEVNEDGTTGGSHRSLFELARHLDPARFAPIVLFYQDNRFRAMLEAEGIPVRLFDQERRHERAIRDSGRTVAKAVDALAAIRRRADLIRRQRIDLIHLNNSPKMGCDDWLPAARLKGVPIVASVRGDDLGAEKWWRLALLRRFDRVVPVSHCMGEVMARVRVPDEKIRVIHNGVDVAGIRSRIQRSRGQVRAELGVSEQSLLAVMVGNLREWKGQMQVAHATALATRTGADVHLAIVGSPGGAEDERYARDLRATIEALGIGHRVSLLGARTDVSDLFAAADVAVHASTMPEPFGLVLVEALATGTPVLASDRGGPKEVITGSSGFLHNPDDPADLADLLVRLDKERPILSDMRPGASARAEEFDISKTVRGIQSVYEELLDTSSCS